MADATYNDKLIAALLRERETYVTREMPERLQQVDKQLAALGYDPANAPKTARAKPRQQRDA